jgi:trans-aconitate 2-methyltransferase
MSTAQSHYTFGDNELAAQRLRLLAETFAPSSTALLRRLGAIEGGVVDLGCGPGHTTALLVEALRPAWTVGLERSAKLVAQARARLPDVPFHEHDVTVTPLPAAPAAIVYSRFLLTHLADPGAAVRGWAGALAPGGRLVLEETVGMWSDHPAVQRYYDLVAALQAHYGQAFDVGRRLGDLLRGAGLAVDEAGVATLALPAAQMARLHAMNIRTWGTDEYARRTFDAAELAGLQRTLDAIAAGDEAAPPVRCEMGQAVGRRARD